MSLVPKIFTGIITIVLFIAFFSTLMPVPAGELLRGLNGMDSYESCECNDVQIESKTTNATQMTGTLFDIEQVSQPVIRMLVSVPENASHKYLVVEVAYLTEENRSIQTYRTTVNVRNDKVQIIELEHSEKMEMAPRLRVEAVGWTNNSIDTYPGDQMD